jgi:hypothetical protein
MAGIIKNKGQKPIIVNGVEDHAHVFVGLKPSMAVSDLVRDVKNNSSNFINDHAWIKGRFNWQEGYGAFSYSRSQACHPEPFGFAQDKLREGSLPAKFETLRSRRTLPHTVPASLRESDIVILNQEKHHAKQSFKDEYLDFLRKFEIEHDVKYLSEWIE